MKRARLSKEILGILSAGFWIAGSPMNQSWADGKKIIAAVDAASDRIHEVSKKIHEWKGIGQQAFKSSSLIPG